jgi:hypothetical protein
VIEVPSKNVIQDFDLNLACNVLYVDLAGLNDGRAVKTILPRLNPRKLVCAHSIRPSTQLIQPDRSWSERLLRHPITCVTFATISAL